MIFNNLVSVNESNEKAKINNEQLWLSVLFKFSVCHIYPQAHFFLLKMYVFKNKYIFSFFGSKATDGHLNRGKLNDVTRRNADIEELRSEK